MRFIALLILSVSFIGYALAYEVVSSKMPLAISENRLVIYVDSSSGVAVPMLVEIGGMVVETPLQGERARNHIELIIKAAFECKEFSITLSSKGEFLALSQVGRQVINLLTSYMA